MDRGADRREVADLAAPLFCRDVSNPPDALEDKIAYRRRGIGLELVRRAAELARTRGCTWLHVDYESALTPFYRAAGFRDSPAGVMRLGRAT